MIMLELQGNYGAKKKTMYLDKVRVPQLLSAFWCPPEAAQNGQIYFHDIGDYISQTQKLERISELASLQPLTAIG